MKNKDTNKKDNNKKELNDALVILSIITTIMYSYFALPSILSGIHDMLFLPGIGITEFTIFLSIPYILFIIGIIKKRNSFIISTIICQLLIFLFFFYISEFVIKPTSEPEHFNVTTYKGDNID